MASNTYNIHKHEMKSGDCILWQSSRSCIGWLIQRFTSCNHASLIIRPEEFGPFKDRRFVMEAVGKGVVLRLLSEHFREFHGRVYWYPLKDEFDFARGNIADWAIAQEGTPYDYGSLFRQLFGRVSADIELFFCSEFCYFGWKENGIPVDCPTAPRPGDIPDLKIFKYPVLIFEG